MPDSSPATSVETPVVDTSITDVKPAESSPAEKPAGTMLDAVQAALKPKEVSPTSEEPGKSPDGDPTSLKPDQAAEESDELSEEELKGLHEKTQRRFKTLSTKLNAKDAEITDLKPKAEEFDKINTFITNAGMTNEEVGNILTIGALLKSDPKAAYERMTPTYRALQAHFGDILPADLQEQVNQGYLTEQYAKELVKSRSEAAFNASRLRQTDERTQQERQQSEQKQFTESSIAAAEKWESNKATADPDWHLKQKDVAEQVELAIHQRAAKEGRPWFPNSEEIVKLSNDALKRVNDKYKRFVPKPAEIKPVTPGASNRSVAAPKSMLDVVKNAVGKSA